MFFSMLEGFCQWLKVPLPCVWPCCVPFIIYTGIRHFIIRCSESSVLISVIGKLNNENYIKLNY